MEGSLRRRASIPSEPTQHEGSTGSGRRSARRRAASGSPAAEGVCADADAVRTGLTDLKAVDLKTIGLEGLKTELAGVEASIATLTGLKAAVAGLSGDAGVVGKAADIQTAVATVEGAATTLKSALTQCR